jgi:hypothetical protein
LLVTVLFLEKSIAGWWLISQTNRAVRQLLRLFPAVLFNVWTSETLFAEIKEP